MKPKDKATRLVESFRGITGGDFEMDWIAMRQCALVLADEIISELTGYEYDGELEDAKGKITFWNEVKAEINKL